MKIKNPFGKYSVIAAIVIIGLTSFLPELMRAGFYPVVFVSTLPRTVFVALLGGFFKRSLSAAECVFKYVNNDYYVGIQCVRRTFFGIIYAA